MRMRPRPSACAALKASDGRLEARPSWRGWRNASPVRSSPRSAGRSRAQHGGRQVEGARDEALRGGVRKAHCHRNVAAPLPRHLADDQVVEAEPVYLLRRRNDLEARDRRSAEDIEMVVTPCLLPRRSDEFLFGVEPFDFGAAKIVEITGVEGKLGDRPLCARVRIDEMTDDWPAKISMRKICERRTRRIGRVVVDLARRVGRLAGNL